MFQSKTIFVVGAGASKELGFPIGEELKHQISNSLGIREDELGRKFFRDSLTRDALGWYARQSSIGMPRFLTAAQQICDALPLAISIDNYLEARENDGDVELCAKWGIYRSILNAEAKSPIAKASYNTPPDLGNKAVQSAWHVVFMRHLTEGVSYREVENLFNNVSFVIYNYDRAIEHFLYHALQVYYRMPSGDVADLLNQVRFYHPYGVVGRLPWQIGSGPAMEYGGELAHSSFGREHVAAIKTFSERIKDIQVLDDLLEDARLVFLGLSYIAQNMQLLSAAVNRVASVVGTTCGFSDDDARQIEREIQQTWELDEHVPISLAACTCYDLFLRYSKTISR